MSSTQHSLNDDWTLWYDPPQNPAEWKDLTTSLANLSTVEEFWQLYNCIKTPSNLNEGSNYHLFKKNIKPTWEDKANENGGKWSFILNQQLDNQWLTLMLACIGANFPHHDEICGVVVSSRGKKSRVALWTRNHANQSQLMEIGAALKKFLSLSKDTKLEFNAHQKSFGTKFSL